MDLNNRTTIVTGASSGIGRALAIEFAAQGANVACAARREKELNETVATIEGKGGKAIAIPTDVADAASVERMVRQALDAFGRIDVLFNNAGSFVTLGGLWEVNADEWWHDVTVNLRGPMLCSRAVLPHMIQRDEGIIIQMNGGGSGNPMPGGSAYASSKAALLRLTDSMAKELERIGSAVLVLAMGPGFVRTPMTVYQAEQAQGLKWLPSSKTALDAGKDRPATDCARATMRLIAHACPAFAGRVFSPDDDFAALAHRAEELVKKDLGTLRMRGW